MNIRNSVTIYVGLKKAKENSTNTIITGDGCDELFAGYSFLHRLENKQLSLELQKLWSVMRFSSTELAKVMGMEIKLPYLDPKFKKEKEMRMRELKPYQLNEDLLRGKDILIMHDMPIHRGYEIADDLVRSANSMIYDQSENRLYSAKAILLKLLG